jgi:hypothetical protein
LLCLCLHSLCCSSGYQAKSIEDVPGNPTLAVTADFNYVLRFYKGNGRVWVKDVQGNDVTTKRKPIQFGQLSVIPVDRVLMSGGYFFNGLVSWLYSHYLWVLGVGCFAYVPGILSLV